MEQLVEQRSPQREHQPDVEQPLAVVAEQADGAAGEDQHEERRTGGVQPIEARRAIERLREEDAIDDEPHEQRLGHLKRGACQREDEQNGE